MHTGVFDTRLDMADVRLAVGGSWQVPRGFGFELLATLGFQLGRTQAGRGLAGFEMAGGEMIFHISWFRLGFGGRLGGLAVSRSTSSNSDEYGLADGYAWIGVEPFAAERSWPIFIDLEAHALDWGGQDLHGFELRAGIRYCGKDCVLITPRGERVITRFMLRDEAIPCRGACRMNQAQCAPRRG